MTDVATAPPAISRVSFLRAIACDIKLSHTVFALPFAVLGMFLAAGHVGRWPAIGEIILIVVCMVFARTVAMAVNRWADAPIDKDNPRTAGRAIPSGHVSRTAMLGVATICSVGFMMATSGFWLLYDNAYPAMLSPIVLLLLGSYSFAKRITWLCHIILGLALAISPIAAALAIEPSYLQEITIYLLAGMVACWVAGFDVIYALADVACDREQGLFSMPASLGVEPALWISRGLHGLTILALGLTWQSSVQLNLFFAVGITLAFGLLLLEHGLIARSKTRHIHLAFFTLNGTVSLLLGAAGIVDIARVLLRGA